TEPSAKQTFTPPGMEAVELAVVGAVHDAGAADDGAVGRGAADAEAAVRVGPAPAVLGRHPFRRAGLPQGRAPGVFADHDGVRGAVCDLKFSNALAPRRRKRS